MSKGRRRAEIYVSTDLESDGPVPGLHSMLSFASAAFDASQSLLDTFWVNLQTLPDATSDPVTMRWWQTQSQAWTAARAEPLLAPQEAMSHYLCWLRGLSGKPVFVGYPASFDFPFICYYLARFTGENPFGFAALDIKSYAMAALRREAFHTTVKRDFPAAWFDPDRPHTHVALDDAIEQGVLFGRMRAARSPRVSNSLELLTNCMVQADTEAARQNRGHRCSDCEIARMLLDEGQVAVTELVMRCRAVAARYQQAIELAPDAAMRSKLDTLANQRREQADALDRLLRDAGVMPHDSEAEAETLREMLTYLRANFGGAPHAVLQQVISQGEASLREAIEAARAQPLSSAFERQINELAQSVEAERPASAPR